MMKTANILFWSSRCNSNSLHTRFWYYLKEIRFSRDIQIKHLEQMLEYVPHNSVFWSLLDAWIHFFLLSYQITDDIQIFYNFNSILSRDNIRKNQYLLKCPRKKPEIQLVFFFIIIPSPYCNYHFLYSESKNKILIPGRFIVLNKIKGRKRAAVGFFPVSWLNSRF